MPIFGYNFLTVILEVVACLASASSTSQAALVRERGFAACGGNRGVVDIVDAPIHPLLLFRGGGGSQFESDPYFFELRYDSQQDEYLQILTSPYSPVHSVATGNVIAGPAVEAILLLYTGQVEVRDLLSGALLSTFGTPNTLYGLEVANSDADSLDEIHVSSSQATRAYDADGRQVWSSPILSEPGVIIAQLDSDSGAEAAAPSAVVLDVATGSVQVTLPGPFRDVFACDLDSNGIEELLCVSDQAVLDPVEIWDVHHGAILARLLDPSWRVGHSAQSVAAGDLDHDGIPEVFCGFHPGNSATAPDLLIWDLRTGAALLEARTQTYGVYDMRAVNLDDDRAVELVLVSGDRVSIIAPLHNPGTAEWVSNKPSRFLAGPALGDLDGDGEIEVVVATGDDGYYDIRLSMLAPRDFRTLDESNPITDIRKGAVHDLKVADLNADGRDEILVAGRELDGQGRSGFARAYGVGRGTGELQKFWRAGLFSADPRALASIEAADLNRDGRIEILVGEHQPIHRGAQVVLYEYPCSMPRRRFDGIGPPGSASITGLRAVDLDRDGFPDVIALVEGIGLFLFDQFSDAPKGRFLGPLTSMDVSKDEQGQYLLLGSEDGTITALRWLPGRGLTLEGRTVPSLGAVRAIAAGPSDSAWVLVGGRLHLVNLRRNRIEWFGEDYGWSEPTRMGLRIAADLTFPGGCLLGSGHALLGYRAN